MKADFVEGTAFGGPQVLQMSSENLRVPGAGEVLVRQDAVGVNFIDILLRPRRIDPRDAYRLGLEGAGEIIEVGEGVAHLQAGDRVVYAGGPAESYASARLLPANRAVRLPGRIDSASAAAVFFNALTADYLVHRLRAIAPGDAVLITAAAEGFGSLAVPLPTHLGATVIGTVGNKDKADSVRAIGCDHVLVLPSDGETAAAKVREWTDGRGRSRLQFARHGVDGGLAGLARPLWTAGRLWLGLWRNRGSARPAARTGFTVYDVAHRRPLHRSAGRSRGVRRASPGRSKQGSSPRKSMPACRLQRLGTPTRSWRAAATSGRWCSNRPNIEKPQENRHGGPMNLAERTVANVTT